MVEMYTLMSMVMGISGATYTCIVAIRNWLGEGVKNLCAKAATEAEPLVKAETSTKFSEIYNQAVSKTKQLTFWERVWHRSYAVPVVLFFATAYTMAIHVLWCYWSDIKAPITCWNFYRWVLAGLVSLDLLSVIGKLISRTMIKHLNGAIASLAKMYHEANAETGLRPVTSTHIIIPGQ